MLRDAVSWALAHTHVPASVAEALAPEWPELAYCPHLSPAAWSTLWQHQARDAALTVALVSRPLTVVQFDTVISTERRTGPLRATLAHNTPSRAQWWALAARPPKGPLAGDISTEVTCPDELRARFVAAAPPAAQI
jgi:hypothetical protein